MHTYLLFWKRYFNFTGYSEIKEFWIPFLVHVVLTIVFLGSGQMTALKIFLAVIFIPTMSVSIRRLRDAGNPLIYILLAFVPMLNLAFLVKMTDE